MNRSFTAWNTTAPSCSKSVSTRPLTAPWSSSPRDWNLAPRRDLDWSLINRLHRSRGAQKQGPKLSSARIEKLDEGKHVKAVREKASKLKLKGEALHDYICAAMKRDPPAPTQAGGSAYYASADR